MSKLPGFDPGDRNQVKKMIDECDKWDGYAGTNVDGEEVMVFVSQGQGMKIMTKHHEKPRWWEVVFYDADGFQEGIAYEPTAELEALHEELKAKRAS